MQSGAVALTVSPSMRWPARRLEGRLEGERLLLQELGVTGGTPIAFRRLPRPELERLLQAWRGELATARALRAPAEDVLLSIGGVKRWTAAVDAGVKRAREHAEANTSRMEPMRRDVEGLRNAAEARSSTPASAMYMANTVCPPFHQLRSRVADLGLQRWSFANTLTEVERSLASGDASVVNAREAGAALKAGWDATRLPADALSRITLPTAPGAEREPLAAYEAAAARARAALPALKGADERAGQAAEALVQEARAIADPIAGPGLLGGRC